MVRILFLIDDDLDDREIFQEAVKHCNPQINLIFAGDGLEALEFLDTATILPDVIFLDYNMPRMNGLDCLRELKNKRSKYKEIPTIMYTTSGDREQEKVILLLGADYYMRKTTSFEELCKELERLLESIGQQLQDR